MWEDPVANYFGKYLYASDPELRNVAVALGNSGVIGFDNTARVGVLYDLVRMIASGQSPEQLSTYTDQPIFDYVLHKTGQGNFEMLNQYCRLTQSADGASPMGRRGMVHFHLPANATVKAAAMQSYLNVLG